MKTLMDPERYMPDEAALAEIQVQIDAYNKARPAVYDGCMKQAVIALVIYAAFGVLICFYCIELGIKTKDFVYVAGGLLLGAWGLWILMWSPMERHRAVLRERLFPKLFGFIEDVTYQKNPKPGFLRQVSELKLVQYATASNDDLIAGRHEGMDFALLETTLKVGNKNKDIVFRGLIFHFRLADPFPGMLVVAKRGGWLARTMKDFWRTGPNLEMSSGNRQLDESHQFYSDNRNAARPIIAGPLTSVLTWLGNEWHGGDVRIALSGEHGYLMLPSTHDYFALPGDSEDIVYKRHIQPLVRELVMALAVAHVVGRSLATED
jgi:hypothetical protein